MASVKKKGLAAVTAASARAARNLGRKPSSQAKPSSKGKPATVLKKKAILLVAKKNSHAATQKTNEESRGPVKKKRRIKRSSDAKARKTRDARRAKMAGTVEEDENESSEEELKFPKGAPKPEMVMNSELKSEGLEYEAEKVVGSRLDNAGNREYNVKWMGWSSKHNTWEPAVNLVNSFDLITEFDEANPYAA